MESILRRKSTAMNRRGSLSKLLHIQKPAFSVFQEQPPRYYDLVDSPGHKEPLPLATHRQHISPRLESDVRYACSLLIYRVERGVPSPPANQSSKPSTRMGDDKGEHSSTPQDTTAPQIDAKFFSPKVGTEVAALKDKLDSGVGLTQQPSRQTMRLLKSSHSDAHSSESEPISESLSSQVRSTTSSSHSSYAEDPKSPSFVRELQQDGERSAIMEDAQTKGQDTVSFLGGTCNVGPKTAEALDDMEVFLNPEVGMEASGIPRFTSPSAFLNSTLPSFGVSTGLPQGRLPELITQSKFLGDRPDTVAGPDPSQPDSAENEPGVIIDSNGCVHVLTAAEEAQRKLDLQQAVMAKMNAGGVQSNSHALQKPPNEALLHQNLQVKQRPAHSRLQTSSSHQSKATTLNRQSRSETSSPTNSTSALFQKITGLFRTRRASDQANNTLVERPFSIAH